MKLERLLNSGGELIQYGYETVKKPYAYNINFYPEIYDSKKRKRPKENNSLVYFAKDYREMNHWKPGDKIFDVDNLDHNWGIYTTTIVEHENTKNTYYSRYERLSLNLATPSISLGKTFFLTKIHKLEDPNLYLNSINFYACSQFMFDGKLAYIPFKVRFAIDLKHKQTIQEVYNNINDSKLLDSKVYCANIIVANLPLRFPTNILRTTTP